MTTQPTSDRINHKDLEFDADYTTVAGTDARQYMIGSFINLAARQRAMDSLYDRRGAFPMQEDEYRRRVADGQDK